MSEQTHLLADMDAALDVDGAQVLDEVRALLRRYVVFPSDEAADAVTLYAAATYAATHANCAPRLIVKSPEKRCGKTRLIVDVLGQLVHEPLTAVSLSPASLVHSIDPVNPPTIILDETGNAPLTLRPTDGIEGAASAFAAAACPAAGRYARHRATVRWRGGGNRHEANWSDRGARRPVEHVRRRGDGRPALAVGAGNGWQVFPLAQTFTEPTVYYGFEIQGRQLVAKVFMKALKTVDGLCSPWPPRVLKVMLMNPANGKTITGNLTRPAKIIANPDGSTTVLGRGTSKSLSRQMRRRAPGCLVCSSLPARRRQCSRRTGNISLSLHGHVPVDVCAALS